MQDRFGSLHRPAQHFGLHRGKSHPHYRRWRGRRAADEVEGPLVRVQPLEHFDRLPSTGSASQLGSVSMMRQLPTALLDVGGGDAAGAGKRIGDHQKVHCGLPKSAASGAAARQPAGEAAGHAVDHRDSTSRSDRRRSAARRPVTTPVGRSTRRRRQPPGSRLRAGRRPRLAPSTARFRPTACSGGSTAATPACCRRAETIGSE